MNKRDERWLIAILMGCLLVGFGSFWMGRNRSQTPLPQRVTARPTLTPTPRRVVIAPTPTPSVANALQSIEKPTMLAHVRHLSQSIGPRLAGTAAENQAADYIVEQFRVFGYQPQRQQFKTKKGERSSNVLARRAAPGKKRVLVGAHFDSVRVAPGANDNASGVAVLLELARVLAQKEPTFDVTFVAFGSEEGAHDGSEHFTRTMTTPPDGMINMDMVGVGKVFAIGKWEHPDLWLMNHCGAASHAWNCGAKVGSKFGGKSDYASFSDANVPVAAFAWDDDPNYHTARDSLDHIDEAAFTHRLHMTARVLVAALLTPEGGFDDKRAAPLAAKQTRAKR